MINFCIIDFIWHCHRLEKYFGSIQIILSPFQLMLLLILLESYQYRPPNRLWKMQRGSQHPILDYLQNRSAKKNNCSKMVLYGYDGACMISRKRISLFIIFVEQFSDDKTLLEALKTDLRHVLTWNWIFLFIGKNNFAKHIFLAITYTKHYEMILLPVQYNEKIYLDSGKWTILKGRVCQVAIHQE